MKKNSNLSLFVLLAICSILSIYRITNVHHKEISWDVLGYYMYLPATFVHHDPLLKDISWLKKVNSEKELASTLYMVKENKKGEPMYFFLMGMALFYLPFFFAGSAYAAISGLPMDGFSPPYQYALVIGAIIYTIIGLIFLRKILRYFFSEQLSSIVMVIIVFGTNYINHLTIKDLETVNVLFMLTTIVVWNTIKWHENFKSKHLIITVISIALITLVKPSEVFVFLIPLLWNVTSIKQLKEKFLKLYENKKVLIFVGLICIVIFSPQLIYWYLKTGNIIYDSYKNPGIGLDFFSPHILDVLFSYRKGWFLYTPVMIFSLIGFYFIYKNNKSIFYASIIYFFVSFFIISCWTEWWYGAAFSMRPLISTYPILAISLGYFIFFINRSRIAIKITFWSFALFFIFLNQFQWWQYKNYILDPYRTTKAYYWATFLKTSVTDSDKELLLVNRGFSGNPTFEDRQKYEKKSLKIDHFDFSSKNGNAIQDTNGFLKIKADEEFHQIINFPYSSLTQKDHFWLRVNLNIRGVKDETSQDPCLVISMERKNGSYGYLATELKFDSCSNCWKNIDVLYLTPEIRNEKDHLTCYIWNRGKSAFDIDEVNIEIFEKRN